MKKVLALLLALLMIAGLLVGCGGGNEENPTNPSDTTSQAPVVLPDADTTSGDPVESTEYELPLTDDYTFTYWRANNQTFEEFATYDDNLYVQWLEAQTGVHIQWEHPMAGGETESFQTMMLSGSYPDFVQAFSSYYSGGMDKAIQDGVALRLNELVDQYMPNYRSVVYSSNDIFIQCVTDTGNLWGIQHITDRTQGCYMGLGIRQDWLDRAGISIDTCYYMDGFEAALTAMKEYTYDAQGPLFLGGSAIQFSGALNGSFGVGMLSKGGNFLNVDGKVTYSGIMPGLKDYAATLSDWYAKGLINKNYIAANAFVCPENYWANGEVACGEFIYTGDKMYAASAAVSELNPCDTFQLSAIPSPKLNASDSWSDIHVRMFNDRVRPGNAAVITTGCTNVELACKWFDYMWTEEGKHAAQWGPYEGEYGDLNATYYIDETDANGDGFKEGFQPWTVEKYRNASAVQQKVSAYNWPTWAVWSREYTLMEPQQIAFADTWDQVGYDWVLPGGITLTKEEGDEASSIVANCNTYTLEWLANVIVGEKSADSFDTELVPQLENMNIHRAEELYQTAPDRYYARANYAN